MDIAQEMKNSFPKMEKLFKTEVLQDFANSDNIGKFNFGIGTIIRHKFLRPKNRLYKAFIELGISNLDTMSMIVMLEFQKYLK